MASRKKTGNKVEVHQPTLFDKIGEQAKHLKEEIIAGKDHLLEVASEKIAAIKLTIKEYKAEKKAYTQKIANANRPLKKAIKKSATKAAKKVIPVKKKASPEKPVKAKKKAATKKPAAKKTAKPKKVAKRIILRKRSK